MLNYQPHALRHTREFYAPTFKETSVPFDNCKCFFKRLLKSSQYVPRVIVTDKLRSYGAAQRQLFPDVEHRQSRYLNNRAENSHRPTGGESDRCSGSNRPNKPRTSSPLSRLSIAIFVHVVTDLPPLSIV